jgi:hypothetical protein
VAITFREIHEIRRLMTDILLSGKLERWKYTRYNLYSLGGIVYFRVEIYSPNIKDVSVCFIASEIGEIEICIPDGEDKKFAHQGLVETLRITNSQMAIAKLNFKNF